MTSPYSDIRELKSFRLLNKVKKLNLFFTLKNTSGLIVSCAGLHPKQRIETYEQFIAQNLKITKISNKLILMLCRKNNINIDLLQNLLQGSLFLIQDNTIENTLTLTKTKLDVILNYTRFKVRFLFWNQTIYRADEGVSLIKTVEKPTVNLLLTLKTNPINLIKITETHIRNENKK